MNQVCSKHLPEHQSFHIWYSQWHLNHCCLQSWYWRYSLSLHLNYLSKIPRTQSQSFLMSTYMTASTYLYSCHRLLFHRLLSVLSMYLLRFHHRKSHLKLFSLQFQSLFYLRIPYRFPSALHFHILFHLPFLCFPSRKSDYQGIYMHNHY